MRSLIVLAVASLLLSACNNAGEPAPETRSVHAKTVRLAQVQRSDASRSFALTGITRAAQRAVTAFQVSGTLDKRAVNLGDKVAAGDFIASLNNPQAKPQVDAARARVQELETRLAQAGRDVDRVQNLFDQSAATREEMEQTRAQRDALRASLNSARAELSRASRTLGENRITAPVAGEVEQVFFEPGEFVPPGQPVVAISGSGVMEVEIGVPENLLSDVQVGQTAQLRLPLFNDRKIQGTVSQVASAAGGPGQLFQVVITLSKDQDLRAGLTVEWQFESSQPRRLTVPVSAIASPGGGTTPRVYRVVDGHARAVPVKLGAIVDDRVVIEGDLQAGDEVISVGLNNLSDGRAVEVLK